MTVNQLFKLFQSWPAPEMFPNLVFGAVHIRRTAPLIKKCVPWYENAQLFFTCARTIQRLNQFWTAHK